VAVAAAAGLSAAAILAAPVETVSVGKFSVMLARSLGARLSTAEPEKSAATFLGRHGLEFGSDLSRPVLGQDLVLYGRAVGASVSTVQPAAPASLAQVAGFIGAVRGSVLATQSASTGTAGGSAKGKGTTNGNGTGGASGTGSGKGNGGSKEDGINASCRGREARDGRNGTPASPADPNATAPPCDGDGGEPTP
jgi:hypothetical protein